jgi:hypothetical protein
MTDAAFDPSAPDAPLTDMAPFFDRFDRRVRRLLAVSLCVSLVLSAVIFTHSLDTAAATGAKIPRVVWVMGIAFAPLLTAVWWIFTELTALGRRKASRPDGRYPASLDDARNGMRIANGGLLFTAALAGTAILQQAMMVPFAYGYRFAVGEWVARAMMLAVGAATLYLGNLWPRMPTARTPQRTAAIAMRANRVSGWVMVVFGLLLVLLGLLLPVIKPYLPFHPHG